MNTRVPIADRIAERTLAHTVNLFRFDAGLRRRIRRILTQQVQRKLVAATAAKDPTAPARAAYREARVKSLVDEAKTITRAGYRAAATTHAKAMEELAGVEEEFARLSVNRVVGTRLLSIGLPERVLREVARTALIDGSPAANWWAGQAERTRTLFERTVRRGLANGDGIGAMVKNVNASMGTPFREAEALVRTSTLSVSNAVRMETLKRNDDVVRGVQVLITLDSRTSEFCLALGSANAAWDLEGNPLPESGWQHPQPPGPPFHWNCRSILSPVIGALDDILAETHDAKAAKIERLPQEIQDSLDGQLAASAGFETWLRSKPDTFVNDLIGKTRAGLWRDGKLTIAQLVDQTGRSLNLAQLQAKVRGVTDKAIREARTA